MLNAMEAKKIAKRKEKEYLIKERKKTMKALKRVQKEMRKGILTAINNGQYGYSCEYSYAKYSSDKEIQLKGYSILANKEYLKEYYQALGYIIKIKDTGFSARIEISCWTEE